MAPDARPHLDSSPACGRRALPFVPDAPGRVISAADVVDDVPAAVDRIVAGRPLTWISGPSATSDLQLNRAEGALEPRRLHVIVVDG